MTVGDLRKLIEPFSDECEVKILANKVALFDISEEPHFLLKDGTGMIVIPFDTTLREAAGHF